MKKLFSLLFVVMFVVVLAGCGEDDDKADTTVLRNAIAAIGNVDELDTEYPDEDVKYSGEGKFIASDDDEQLLAVYAEDNSFILMTILFDKQFLSDKLTVNSISIIYTNVEIKHYVDVEFNDWEDDSKYKSNLNIEQWLDYMLQLNIDDIVSVLKDNKLLDK